MTEQNSQTLQRAFEQLRQEQTAAKGQFQSRAEVQQQRKNREVLDRAAGYTVDRIVRESAAVIVAWPGFFPVTKPVDRTLATVSSLDDHVTDLNLIESAEDRVLLGVEHGDLAGALDRLSPELRSVVQATVLDGLTTREAAQLLGLRQGTVKTRMMRARHVLRKELA